LVCYSPDVVSYSDYFPFGMQTPNRNGSQEFYRYGFNGKESDDEISGENNSYDFGARFYNPRVGRWLSGDPHEAQYPSMSPYSYVANTPIVAIDPDGKDIIVVIEYGADPARGISGHMQLYVSQYKQVQMTVEENGEEVTKTYYVKTGNYFMIENFPRYTEGKSATDGNLQEGL